MEESGGAIGMPLSCFLDNCMGLSILNNSTGLSEDVNRLRSATALTAHCHRLLRYVPLPPNIFRYRDNSYRLSTAPLTLSFKYSFAPLCTNAMLLNQLHSNYNRPSAKEGQCHRTKLFSAIIYLIYFVYD